MRTRPANSAANSSTTGATMRQGPHQGAHRSSNTGSGERSISDEKVASVTTTGLLSTGRGFLHRPHTGCRPSLTFSNGTRLLAPQVGQRINCVSAIFFATSLGCGRSVFFSFDDKRTARLDQTLAQMLAAIFQDALDLRLVLIEDLAQVF